MLQSRAWAVIAPHGSLNGAGVAYGVVPWMLWMWNHACGGLPVDFQAAVAAVRGCCRLHR
jgi:hypothetical protein